MFLFHLITKQGVGGVYLVVSATFTLIQRMRGVKTSETPPEVSEKVVCGGKAVLIVS